MAARTCETCRAIIGALIRVGAPSTQLGDVEEEGKAQATSTVPLDHFDARLRSLVKLKRAYERDLPANEPDTVEHEHKKGIVVGMQMAIDKICKETGIEVDDPPPPKARRRALPTTAPASLVAVPAAEIAPHTTNGLSKMAARLLRTAVARGRPIPNDELATLSGYSTSGSFSEALADLRDGGLFSGNGSANKVTPLGVARAGKVQPLPTGQKLLAHWQSKLDVMPAKLLGVIVEIAAQQHEDAIPNNAIAEAAEYQMSGSFSSAMARLRKLNLIDRKTNRPDRKSVV